ncbi:MAG: LysR family transcriptional regulator [Rhodoferax sp.]|nr:LysR family transcriptional regulator [Rhodoferax sp.]
MDKLDAMQTFVRVAQAGSFTAVADQLQVARSAVTRQIAALETHLAAKLITRSTRSLTLTAAGSAYLEKCRVILNMVDAAESSLTEENAVPRGRIRLALPHSFGLQRLMPALLDFANAQPHVELLLNFSDQRSNLVEEGIDLAIRITANLQPGDILRQLGSCRLLTVAAPTYLALHGQPKHPAQLQHHECLVYSMSSNTATWPYSVADATGGMGGAGGVSGVNGQVQQFAVRGRLTANNGVALLQATAQGMGIALQPDFLADPFIARQEVVEILQDFASPPLGIYAVLPSNRYIPHRVGVLMDYLAGVLKDADQAAA